MLFISLNPESVENVFADDAKKKFVKLSVVIVPVNSLSPVMVCGGPAIVTYPLNPPLTALSTYNLFVNSVLRVGTTEEIGKALNVFTPDMVSAPVKEIFVSAYVLFVNWFAVVGATELSGKLLNVFIPAMVSAPVKETFVSAYVLFVNWFAVVGATELSGKLLNVLIPAMVCAPVKETFVSA